MSSRSAAFSSYGDSLLSAMYPELAGSGAPKTPDAVVAQPVLPVSTKPKFELAIEPDEEMSQVPSIPEEQLRELARTYLHFMVPPGSNKVVTEPEIIKLAKFYGARPERAQRFKELVESLDTSSQ